MSATGKNKITANLNIELQQTFTHQSITQSVSFYILQMHIKKKGSIAWLLEYKMLYNLQRHHFNSFCVKNNINFLCMLWQHLKMNNN